MHNSNSHDYLEKIKNAVIDNLRSLAHAPSVQMTDVPRDSMAMNDEDDAILDDLDEDEHPDRRHTKRRWDKCIEKDGELEESDDEEENHANGVHRQPNGHRRRNIMDYQNPDAAPDDPAEAEIFDKAVNGYKGEDTGIVDAGEGSARSSTVNAEEDQQMPDADPEDVAQETETVAPPPPLPAVTSEPAFAQEATPPASPPTVATTSVAAPTLTNPPAAPVPINGDVTEPAAPDMVEAEDTPAAPATGSEEP